jgi:hypothetical protein
LHVGGKEIREEIDNSQVCYYNQKKDYIDTYYRNKLLQNESQLKMINNEIDKYETKIKSNETEIYIAKRKK